MLGGSNKNIFKAVAMCAVGKREHYCKQNRYNLEPNSYDTSGVESSDVYRTNLDQSYVVFASNDTQVFLFHIRRQL